VEKKHNRRIEKEQDDAQEKASTTCELEEN
jgi:hypothetical protein